MKLRAHKENGTHNRGLLHINLFSDTVGEPAGYQVQYICKLLHSLGSISFKGSYLKQTGFKIQ